MNSYASLIDAYAAGPEALRQAVAGLTRADLLAVPIQGTWSIQQIVTHVVDSDLIASDRMKRVIAEDRPLLVVSDETKCAARLPYDDMPLELAVSLFTVNRDYTSRLLRALPDSAFSLAGVHTVKGLVTLAELVAGFTQHLAGHLTHVKHKRALLGKPLA